MEAERERDREREAQQQKAAADAGDQKTGGPRPPDPTPLLSLTGEQGGNDAHKPVDERERQSREFRAGLHPLQHRFVCWYTRRTPGVRNITAYEDSMKKIAEFSTVEGYWGCYCHLTRAVNLPVPTDLHVFKEGIRPLWEDAANRNGGKWIIRFKKVVSGRYWEDLVLAMVGDQLEPSDTVCGAVLSIRFGEDILSIWNRNSADNQAVMLLRDSIKRHLHLPLSYLMEYKPHDASLKDMSSFRNTWLRG